MSMWRLIPIASLCLMAACGSGVDGLPDELEGRWLTDHARYAGRFLTLTEDTICFGASEALITPYPIDEVHQTRVGNEMRVEIAYREPTGDISYFRIRYEFSDRSVEFVTRPGVVWRKLGVEPADLPQGDSSADAG